MFGLAVHGILFLILACKASGDLTEAGKWHLNKYPHPQDEMRFLDSVIIRYMHERGVPGASLALSKGGQLLYTKGYGRAGAGRIVTPWSLFRIGSVSKTVTAIVTLHLQERGKLNIEDAVFGKHGILNEYAPKWAGDPRLFQVTVKHLLEHSGGWDQNEVGDPLHWWPNASHDSLLNYMMDQTLQFTPGRRYAYSNLGYLILGRIIEKVTNKPYEVITTELLRRTGIRRMKLGHTQRELADYSEVQYFTKSSVYTGNQLVPDPYGGFSLELMDSTAGWIASAVDLLRLLDCLNKTRCHLVKNDTFAAMLGKPEYSRESDPAWYGLGVAVKDWGETWWHSGTLDGMTGVLSRDKSGFSWSVMMNYQLQTNDLNDLMKHALSHVPSWSNTASSSVKPVFADVASNNSRYVAKLMIPEDKFYYIYRKVAQEGYRMTWIDAYDYRGRVYFNTIWNLQNGKKWKAYIGLTDISFRKRLKVRQARGYRLTQIESYLNRGKLRYAAIFVKEYWAPWLTYIGYSPREHRKQLYSLMKQGFRPVVQSVTEHRNKIYISAIYDKLSLGHYKVQISLPHSKFLSVFYKQVKSGRTLSYVQAFRHKGETKFSVIFAKSTTHVWASRHDLTEYMLLNQMKEYADANVPLSCVTGYQMGDLMYFAALWR